MKLKAYLLAGMALAIAACSPSDTTAPADGIAAETPPTTLTIYSARHYDSDVVLYDAFEAQTGINVQVREANASQLLETLKAEGANSPADVLIAADAGSLWRFQDAGLTRSISAPTLEQAIPAKYRETDGHWYGVSKRLRGVVYDTSRWQASDVDNWAKLAAPEMQGEICVRASSNIYNLSLMAEMIERIGEDAAGGWATSIAENMARQPQGGDTDQIRAVAAGECSIAIANHYYLARLSVSNSDSDRAAAEKVAFAVPDFGDDGGAHINVTAAAVTATSAHPAEATAFLEFLMQAEGQTFLTMETRELPMLEGVDAPAGAEVLPSFNVSAVPLESFGQNQATAQRLYDLAGWN